MANFSSVGVGDRISFVTANNGFGSDGRPYVRTGTIVRKTEKTVAVDCDSNLIGKTACLTKLKWHERCVRLV